MLRKALLLLLLLPLLLLAGRAGSARAAAGDEVDAWLAGAPAPAGSAFADPALLDGRRLGQAASGNAIEPLLLAGSRLLEGSGRAIAQTLHRTPHVGTIGGAVVDLVWGAVEVRDAPAEERLAVAGREAVKVLLGIGTSLALAAMLGTSAPAIVAGAVIGTAAAYAVDYAVDKAAAGLAGRQRRPPPPAGGDGPLLGEDGLATGGMVLHGGGTDLPGAVTLGGDAGLDAFVQGDLLATALGGGRSCNQVGLIGAGCGRD